MTDSSSLDRSWRWYHALNRYQWFVFVVAALGWMFDCLDQQLFVLARQPAMKELLQDELKLLSDPAQIKAEVDSAAALTTAIFLLGWATGGLFFGVLGDRVGRAKTMLVTILLYSIFTGLSAASRGFWDFALFRFLTGLGVGGEFAVGVALVAEVMPDRVRPHALSSLQALSAVGNITAALLNMAMGSLFARELIPNVWRPLFVIGALPALLAVLIRRRLHEPEQWMQIAQETEAPKRLGSYSQLLGDPRWRRNALVGLGLAFSGVVGLWAVGFFTMDLVGNVLTQKFQAAGMAEKEVTGSVTHWKSIASIMINLGACAGMYAFAPLTQRIGRRPAFAIAFVSALASTAAVFGYLQETWHILVLVPIMGFCQLSLFAGYAIYLPELFPTHLRSTGISFCYNVGRFVAALGPFVLSHLTKSVFQHTSEPLRYAGLTMCCIFIIGLLILPFAPETKGKPLPE